MAPPRTIETDAQQARRCGLRQIAEVVLLLGLLLGATLALVQFVDVGLDALARQTQ